MNCKTCNHDDHEPGKCKQCNCGSSEIAYPQGVRVRLNLHAPDCLTRRSAHVVPKRKTE